MNLAEAKRILRESGYRILTESVTPGEIEGNTVYEEEYEIYSGKLGNFWWSFSSSFGMSRTDLSQKGRQFKVSAGIVGQPRTRKCLATKANYSNVFEIIANYLNSLE